jgi:hypothetical protein
MRYPTSRRAAIARCSSTHASYLNVSVLEPLKAYPVEHLLWGVGTPTYFLVTAPEVLALRDLNINQASRQLPGKFQSR